jgi:hypothetical protein
MSWKLGFKSVRSGPLVNFISGDSDSPGKSYTRIKCCQRFVLPCPRPLPRLQYLAVRLSHHHWQRQLLSRPFQQAGFQAFRDETGVLSR